MQTKSLSSWSKSIRANARGVWLGEIDVITFSQSMNASIRRHFNMAWNEGAATCGVLPDERTAEENQALNEQIIISMNSVFNLYQYADENSKANDGLWVTVLTRLELWENSYVRVFELAKIMGCENTKYQWVYGPTEHCSTCRRLNGKVYRASVWQEIGIYPRSSLLECRGFRCQCQLVPTNARLTPGRRPQFKTAQRAADMPFDRWLKEMVDCGMIINGVGYDTGRKCKTC